MIFNSAPIYLRRNMQTTDFVTDRYRGLRVVDCYKAMRRHGISSSEARYLCLRLYIAGSGGLTTHERP